MDDGCMTEVTPEANLLKDHPNLSACAWINLASQAWDAASRKLQENHGF